MATLRLDKFGPAITQKGVADRIYEDIVALNPRENVVVIDMSSVVAMTTQCANIIFGSLYKILGRDIYYQNVEIKNASKAIKFVIDMGLDHAVKMAAVNA